MKTEASFERDAGTERHLWDYLHVVLSRRRLVLAIFAAVVTAGGVRTLLTRPVYESTTQILIEREKSNLLSFKEVAEVDSARDDYFQTQYKLIQSRALAQRVIGSLDLLDDPEFGGPRSKEEIAAVVAAPAGESPLMEKTIDRFTRLVRVQPTRNSRLVTVAVEASRPELAARIANRLSQLYIQQALDYRFQTSSEASQWLGGQIEGQKKKVDSAEKELYQFQQKEGLVNIQERRTLVEQKLKELGSALTELKTRRLEREALWRQMSSTANAEELPEVIRSPIVQSLRIELANLERQQAQLLERYLDQHPEVLKVRTQIDETRRKIRSEAQRVIRAAENDYRAAAAQEGSVSSALDAAKTEALELSRKGLQYDTVKRDVDAGNQVLNSLLSRHQETDIAQELKSSNIRIVDPASVPAKPVRPRPLRDMLLAMLLGAALSVGCAFVLEYIDNTLKTPDDVREHLGMALLGVVPQLADDGGKAVVNDPRRRGPFQEGYRVVRTSLNYSWSESAPRVILVTSTAPGEGKTLTSVNLALTLAALEGKVLLIDADLRRPQCHKTLGVKRSMGLSDVLVGKALPSAAIQVLAGQNLSFLPAGAEVPSPADLLTAQSLQGFLQSAKGLFRWIVLDSPPVGAVADPLILAQLVDGVVLVVGAEMVPRRAVRHAIGRLKTTGARMLGAVLNRAQIEKHSYYYTHYYEHDYGRYHVGGEASKVASILGTHAKGS